MLNANTSAREFVRQAIALVAMLVLAVSATLRAGEDSDPGRVLRVAAPITPESAGRLREAIDDVLKREAARRGDRVFKIILDFNPDDRPNSSLGFGACWEMAKYLRKLQEQGVRTIAYVHAEVSRHSVLPVLACSEIVFSRSGELGDVIRDPGETLERSEQTAYEEMARNRFPVVLIRKMFDRDLVVVRTAAGDGSRYHDARDNKPGEPILLAGTVRYSFNQASSFGICQPDPRETIADVVAAYHLGRESLENEAGAVRTPVAWTIELDGALNPALANMSRVDFGHAVAAKANVLIFVIRCHGGDSESAMDLASYIESLNKDRQDNPIHTIAYYTDQAADTAVFPALACDRIVMHPKASFGQFDLFLQANPGRAEVISKNLEELAARHSYPRLLARGLADNSLQIYRVSPVQGGGPAQFITRSELDEDRARADRRWKDATEVKAADGRCLTMDAEHARLFGFTGPPAEDLSAVYQMEGLEPAQVHDAAKDRNWLRELANFLRDPWIGALLVMVGITCLILELKMPGATLPGVIAAVCFVLYFWSHNDALNGQITWLAVLLFVLGLLLIGLEIFVMPGVGVAGISGTVLVLGSLGLVAYGHWPQSNEEWMGFGRTIGPFGISVLGALFAAFTLARFLPNIPFANRLMLKPIEDSPEFGDESASPASGGPDYSHYLGAIGVAATPLRPAGKVQFGDEFIDVVAEGGYVPPGARVQVIEIEGIRIVVKEV